MSAPSPLAMASPRALVVIVTGPSGAGRTTAINAFEDLGYEPLDNVPLSLLDAVVEPAATQGQPVALGIAAGTRGFSVRALLDGLDRLRTRFGLAALLVFLDCADAVLLTRFSQTRRRHPLAPQEDPASGIARERDILQEIRGRADVVLDTTALTPHDLKAELNTRFRPASLRGLAVSVQSFSYKRGAPHDADMVLDCRFLRNPYWDPALRALDGTHTAIQGFVAQDPLYQPFFDKTADLIAMLLPAYQAEGKAYFSVAFGCTGGRHRSVTLAEATAARIEAEGYTVALRHRELARVGLAERPA
ncbi:MAG: RNase adapter RapZ [Pseudomonadota bacterium]